jgi:hypothetical protein
MLLRTPRVQHGLGQPASSKPYSLPPGGLRATRAVRGVRCAVAVNYGGP